MLRIVDVNSSIRQVYQNLNNFNVLQGPPPSPLYYLSESVSGCQTENDTICQFWREIKTADLKYYFPFIGIAWLQKSNPLWIFLSFRPFLFPWQNKSWNESPTSVENWSQLPQNPWIFSHIKTLKNPLESYINFASSKCAFNYKVRKRKWSKQFLLPTAIWSDLIFCSEISS